MMSQTISSYWVFTYNLSRKSNAIGVSASLPSIIDFSLYLIGTYKPLVMEF